MVELLGHETSSDGIIVSAMAINVIQFEGVRTSPSGGGGNGLASGASTLICVEVISIDLRVKALSIGTMNCYAENQAQILLEQKPVWKWPSVSVRWSNSADQVNGSG